MADTQTREWAREAACGGVDALAAVLRNRVRSGELTWEHLQLGASLGNPAARMLCPGAEMPPWQNESREELIRQAAELGGIPLLARVAADWAEHVLPLWDSEYPDDRRPQAAITAGRVWADCPCEEHEIEASEIAADVGEAIAMARQVWEKRRGAPGESPAWSRMCAAHASEAVATLVENAGDMDDAIVNAADAAHAAHATKVNGCCGSTDSLHPTCAACGAANSPESAWQRLRLAEYVVGEI